MFCQAAAYCLAHLREVPLFLENLSKFAVTGGYVTYPDPKFSMPSFWSKYLLSHVKDTKIGAFYLVSSHCTIWVWIAGHGGQSHPRLFRPLAGHDQIKLDTWRWMTFLTVRYHLVQHFSSFGPLEGFQLSDDSPNLSIIGFLVLQWHRHIDKVSWKLGCPMLFEGKTCVPIVWYPVFIISSSIYQSTHLWQFRTLTFQLRTSRSRWAPEDSTSWWNLVKLVNPCLFSLHFLGI